MDGWGDGREAKEGLVHENDQGLASVESMISLSSTPNLSFSLLFISVGFFFFRLAPCLSENKVWLRKCKT